MLFWLLLVSETRKQVVADSLETSREGGWTQTVWVCQKEGMDSDADVSQENTERKPGRPRSFDEDEVVDDLVELFWASGYHESSMRDLQAATGLSPSSLANAFGAKRDLLDKAVDRYESRAVRRLVGPLEASDEGVNSLQTFLNDLVEWVTHSDHGGCLVINLMVEQCGVPGIEERTRRYRTRVIGALRGALERAQELGEVQAGALDERTNAIVGLVLGINIAARGGTRAEVEGLRDAALWQLRAWHPTPADS